METRLMKRRHQTITNEDLVKAKQESVPKNTQKSTELWNRVYMDWAKELGQEIALDTLTIEALNVVLQKFVMGVRTQEGERYSQSSLQTGLAALFRFWNASNGQQVFNGIC